MLHTSAGKDNSFFFFLAQVIDKTKKRKASVNLAQAKGHPNKLDLKYFERICIFCVFPTSSRMSKQGVIRFHDVHDTPYGCFSVLSPHPITVRHQRYPSVHHFFVCERFKGTPMEEELRTAGSLWEVDKLVKRAEGLNLQREDWDRNKTDVMLLANYYKFKQNNDAQVILLQTGSKTIVDHTAADAFWGDGGDGSGKNLLGVILMAVRKRLLQDEKGKKKAGTGYSGGATGSPTNPGRR